MGGWGIPSGNIATSWLHLASWNLLDSQLCLESKMEPSVAIQVTYLLTYLLTHLVSELKSPSR